MESDRREKSCRREKMPAEKTPAERDDRWKATAERNLVAERKRPQRDDGWKALAAGVELKVPVLCCEKRSDDDGRHVQFAVTIDYPTFGISVKENELLAKEGFHCSFNFTGV
jgi:hypothetical protein